MEVQERQQHVGTALMNNYLANETLWYDNLTFLWEIRYNSLEDHQG